MHVEVEAIIKHMNNGESLKLKYLNEPRTTETTGMLKVSGSYPMVVVESEIVKGRTYSSPHRLNILESLAIEGGRLILWNLPR